MLTRRLSVVFVVLGILGIFAGPAFGEEAGEKAKKGTSTVILKFETMNVPQNMMDSFYVDLNEEVNQHSDMHVVSGGEVTIKELVLTVGCDQSDPECLAGLSEYVDAERMVFGSVKRSDDVYLFSVKLFDFAEERFVRQVSEQTVEGDEATVKEAIPAVVENFLYGDVGKLEVDVNGGRDARVYFDGRKMGPAPTTLENLPLGQHAVTVKTPDGVEKTKFVMLRKGRTSKLNFDIGKGVKPPPTGGSSDGPPILGYTIGGVGLAGIAVGIIGSVNYTSAKQTASDIKCGDSICDPPGKSLSPSQRAKLASETDKKVKSSAIMSIIGYSVGGVGLGVGGYFLYRHFATSPEGPGARAARAIRVTPRRGGLQLGVSIDFK